MCQFLDCPGTGLCPDLQNCSSSCLTGQHGDVVERGHDVAGRVLEEHPASSLSSSSSLISSSSSSSSPALRGVPASSLQCRHSGHDRPLQRWTVKWLFVLRTANQKAVSWSRDHWLTYQRPLLESRDGHDDDNLLDSDWLSLITWSGYWPLIGWCWWPSVKTRCEMTDISRKL